MYSFLKLRSKNQSQSENLPEQSSVHDAEKAIDDGHYGNFKTSKLYFDHL